MKKIKEITITLWKDESGQGTAEYVLMLVAIVAVLGLFRTQIYSMFQNKLGKVTSKIVGFGGGG